MTPQRQVNLIITLAIAALLVFSLTLLARSASAIEYEFCWCITPNAEVKEVTIEMGTVSGSYASHKTKTITEDGTLPWTLGDDGLRSWQGDVKGDFPFFYRVTAGFDTANCSSKQATASGPREESCAEKSDCSIYNWEGVDNCEPAKLVPEPNTQALTLVALLTLVVLRKRAY